MIYWWFHGIYMGIWPVFCRCHLLGIPEIVRKPEFYLNLSWNQNVHWSFCTLFKENINKKCNKYFEYQLHSRQNYTYEVLCGRKFFPGVAWCKFSGFLWTHTGSSLKEEWPSGLKHCHRIGRVLVQTSQGGRSCLETQSRYQALGDLCVENW